VLPRFTLSLPFEPLFVAKTLESYEFGQDVTNHTHDGATVAVFAALVYAVVANVCVLTLSPLASLLKKTSANPGAGTVI
jgi:hypothetical protein